LNIAKSAGQKAIEFASSKLIPKSQQILSKLVTHQGTSQAPTTPNLNNLIAGSGSVKAIKIQDLVRRLNKNSI